MIRTAASYKRHQDGSEQDNRSRAEKKNGIDFCVFSLRNSDKPYGGGTKVMSGGVGNTRRKKLKPNKKSKEKNGTNSAWGRTEEGFFLVTGNGDLDLPARKKVQQVATAITV